MIIARFSSGLKKKSLLLSMRHFFNIDGGFRKMGVTLENLAVKGGSGAKGLKWRSKAQDGRVRHERLCDFHQAD